MTEIWKDISGYEGYYQVSNLGRIRSLGRIIKRNGVRGDQHVSPQILKPFPALGYCHVRFYKNVRKDYKVHRLVAMAFIPNPHNKRQVNHINGIKTDNRAENLEWVNQRENTSHSFIGKNKTSKYVGVSFDKSRNKYITRLNINGIHKYLGAYEDEVEASLAYIRAMEKYEVENTYANSLF